MQALTAHELGTFDDESDNDTPVKRAREADMDDIDGVAGDDSDRHGPQLDSDDEADPPRADVNSMFQEFSAILEASDDESMTPKASQSSARRRFKSKRSKNAQSRPKTAPKPTKPRRIAKKSVLSDLDSDADDPLNSSGATTKSRARRPTILDDDDDDDDESDSDDNGSQEELAPGTPVAHKTARHKRAAPRAEPSHEPAITEDEQEAVEAEAATARAAGDEMLAQAKAAIDPALEGGPVGWHIARAIIPVGKAVAISGRTTTALRLVPGSDTQGSLTTASLHKTTMGNHGRTTTQFCELQLLRTDATPHRWSVWMRSGRVGSRGKTTLTQCGSEVGARVTAFKRFRSLFRARTGRDWADVVRHAFKPVMGKFTVVNMARDQHVATAEAVVAAKTLETKAADAWSSCIAQAASAGAARGLPVNPRGIDWQAMASHLPVTIMRHLANMETIVKAVAADSDEEDSAMATTEPAHLQAVTSPAITALATTIHSLLPLTAFKPDKAIAVSIEQLNDAYHTVDALASAAKARILAHSALATAATVHPADIFGAVARCTLKPALTSLAPLVHDLPSPMMAGNAYDVVSRVLPPVTSACSNTRLLWRCYRKPELLTAFNTSMWNTPTDAPMAAFPMGRGFEFFESPSDAISARELSDLAPSNLVAVGYAVACGREYGLATTRFMRRPPHGYHTVACISKSGLRPFTLLQSGVSALVHGGAATTVEGMWADSDIDANGDDVAAETAFAVNSFVVYDRAQICVKLAVMIESV